MGLCPKSQSMYLDLLKKEYGPNSPEYREAEQSYYQKRHGVTKKGMWSFRNKIRNPKSDE